MYTTYLQSHQLSGIGWNSVITPDQRRDTERDAQHWPLVGRDLMEEMSPYLHSKEHL